MTFSAERITLSPRDEETIGFPSQAAFKWDEFDVLHQAVSKALSLEFECETTYFDALRAACDDTEIAFRSSAFANFGTYRLCEMLVSLDRIAEAQ